MFPTSHQEIARARHADFLRQATQERLAAIAREGRPAALAWLREAGLRWATAAARRAAGGVGGRWGFSDGRLAPPSGL
jgi:hypothetical protein